MLFNGFKAQPLGRKQIRQIVKMIKRKCPKKAWLFLPKRKSISEKTFTRPPVKVKEERALASWMKWAI